MSGPSAAMVFVRPELDRGPILSASGEFLQDLHANGDWDISDQNMPMPTEHGLMIFEGWIEVGSGPDPDVHWVGGWRRLTHWEMCRVRFGMAPHGDERKDESRG